MPRSPVESSIKKLLIASLGDLATLCSATCGAGSNLSRPVFSNFAHLHFLLAFVIVVVLVFVFALVFFLAVCEARVAQSSSNGQHAPVTNILHERHLAQALHHTVIMHQHGS